MLTASRFARFRIGFWRVPTLVQCAVALVLAAALALPGGCSTEQEVDPATLGFQHFYMCSNDADVIMIGVRGTADQCLAACQALSKAILNVTARACWWQDGRAGQPRDCRVCKTAAPVKDAYLNNWAMTLPAAGK
jgi:hypothetical protein